VTTEVHASLRPGGGSHMAAQVGKARNAL